MLDLKAAEFLCLIEAGLSEWEWAQKWLDEKKERRLVLIDPILPPVDHPRVKRREIESPLQIELLAKEIAWEAVFLKMEMIGGKGESYCLFRKELEKAHLAANLLLSDAADWGTFVARHAWMRKDRPVRQGLRLKDAFSNIPAIIVGAGPSLEENGHLLKALQDRALIFAGGSALNVLEKEPHFAASIDREAPYREFKRHPFSETPFCFQSRMNPENFSLVHGEAILFPDSHFQFLNEGQGFDGGWTVGTFLVSLATLMGCDPIVFIGMDYCYQEGRKYAASEATTAHPNLIETIDTNGTKVWTQPDWLMAKKWLEEWAFKHPAVRFIDATQGGLGFGLPIQTTALSEISFEKTADLKSIVYQAVSLLPFASPMEWESWKKSLERCGEISDRALFGEEDDFEEEWAYESLLLPLWRIWRHIFTRALESDPRPDKEKINRLLFFQQVIQEHLRAIE